MTDTIQRDPSAEGSKQPSYDFDEIVKGITRRRVLKRLKYIPDFKRDE